MQYVTGCTGCTELCFVSKCCLYVQLNITQVDKYLAGVVKGGPKGICYIVRGLQQEEAGSKVALHTQPNSKLVPRPLYLLDGCHMGVCCQLHISDVDKRRLVRVTGEGTKEVLEIVIARWAPDK